MMKLTSFGEEVTKKRTEALAKVCSCRENFEKKKRKIRADLERARRLWKETSEKFKWWQSLP